MTSDQSRDSAGIPVHKHLEYAAAFLVLGLDKEAAKELQQLSRQDLCAPKGLSVLIDLYMTQKNWGAVIDISCQYVQLRPREEKGWISWAYALREVDRVAEAREVLLRAEPLHGVACSLLHYNLACYYCLLGELEEARRRLTMAIKIDASFEEEAKTDPDLKGLGN